MDKRKISNSEQLCSVYAYELKSGKGKGETVLAVNNGLLDFAVTPDSGLDIYYLRHQGANLSYLSKNGMTKNNMNGTFAQRFSGGFLYTCGLDAIGQTEGFPQHGTFHSLPSNNTRVYQDESSIKIEGQIENTGLFGSNLKVFRTIKTVYGSGRIELTDIIRNEGFTDEKYILLYHFNLGYPFLNDGTTVEAEIESTTPVTSFSQQNQSDALQMGDPILSEEQVFCHTLKPNCGKISVVSHATQKRVTFLYDTNMLPCFTQWKSMVAGDYALGIEPAVSSFIGQRQYRKIAPDTTATISIVIEIENL